MHVREGRAACVRYVTAAALHALWVPVARSPKMGSPNGPIWGTQEVQPSLLSITGAGLQLGSNAASSGGQWGSGGSGARLRCTHTP